MAAAQRISYPDREMAMRDFFVRAAEIVLKCIGVFCGILILLFCFDVLFPAGLNTISAGRLRNLLYSKERIFELPKQISIEVDGHKAVFRSGTKAYDELVTTLRNSHSDEAFAHAGGVPGFGDSQKICGEITLVSYGIPSRFRLYRFDKTGNFYRIYIPKVTSSGSSIAFLALPNLVDFIKANANPSK